MPLNLLLIVVGGALLYFGAEWLVRGASGIARAFGIRPLVIGLTVVAFGTSAPELVVTMLASVEGKSGIALGNVIGSNIANLGLILAVTALIAPPRVDSQLIQREVPVLLASTGALIVMLADGVVTRAEGAALVVAAVLFTLWLLRTTAPAAEGAPAPAQPRETLGRGQLGLLALVGLTCLICGGKAFVDGASGVALSLGMSERLVGLTIVSVGTSMPELATSVVAALRRQSDIAVGNVVGSNIYNVLLILGSSAVARPIEGSLAAMQTDVICLGVLTAMGALFLRGDRFISRPESMALLVGYASFLGLLIVSP